MKIKILMFTRKRKKKSSYLILKDDRDTLSSYIKCTGDCLTSLNNLPKYDPVGKMVGTSINLSFALAALVLISYFIKNAVDEENSKYRAGDMAIKFLLGAL